MDSSVSRRQFLAGAGAAGLAVAGAGLAGCTPTNNGVEGAAPTATAAGDAAAAPAASRFIPAAYVNPQDYDYRQNTTDFATLLSPLSIGPIALTHRMIKSAAGSATYLAGPSDELLQYYVNFARGGVEMIWVEGIGWLEPGYQPFPGAIEVSEADAIAFGRQLVEACAEYGAKLGYQWAEFAMTPVADMTLEDIAVVQDRGAAIARHFQDMGFVALEINAAGFNLGEHFLSRYHNTRTDEYGEGSIENRARFVVECIHKIKDACGDDFVVQMLIDCIEENDNLSNDATLMWTDNMITRPHNRVTTIEEGIEFARLFEAAGADSMHLRLGPLGNHPAQFGSDLYFILNGIEGTTGYGWQYDFARHWQGQLIANHSGAGMLLDIVARYKQAVSIPCGTVTYMDPAHAPDFFEQALIDGKVDFYLMNRPFTVDTEYVNKLKEGRIDEIAPCTRCLYCHIGSNEMNRAMGYCRVNALTQRVMSGQPGTPETYELPPLSGDPKKVMVIGGGPAGMEAARIAAARGHNVTLYERDGMLGGKLDFASMVKGPHENLLDFKAYLVRQLEITGVTVVLNKAVDAAFIASEAPDAVILATGGLNAPAPVEGNDSVQVVEYSSFMTTGVGENVIVYGSNAQAFDAALWLTVRKKKVQMVTPSANEDLDKQQSQHAHRYMTTALYALGFKAWPGATIDEVGEGQITITTDAGTQVVLPCDAIINAADLLPNKDILDGLSVAETYAIGDCNEPFNIGLAIRSGNDVGRAV